MLLTQFVHSDCTFPKFENSIASRFRPSDDNEHAAGNHFWNVAGVDSVSVVSDVGAVAGRQVAAARLARTAVSLL